MYKSYDVRRMKEVAMAGMPCLRSWKTRGSGDLILWIKAIDKGGRTPQRNEFRQLIIEVTNM